MSHKTLWDTLRKSSIAREGEIMRVENPACPGTPDVHYCLNGNSGWIELKAVPRKMTDGPLAIKDLTIQQRIWIRNWTLAGSRVHILIRVARPGLYLMVRGAYIHLFDQLSISELEGLNGSVSGQTFPEGDILRELIGG